MLDRGEWICKGKAAGHLVEIWGAPYMTEPHLALTSDWPLSLIAIRGQQLGASNLQLFKYARYACSLDLLN